MKNLVIFGTGEIAQLAHFYFSYDSQYQVVAFTVDAQYRNTSNFCGLPVVAFEEVNRQYAPQENFLFVALSYNKMNTIRKDKFLAAKSLGYSLASYVSSKATVYHDLSIGENCFIFEDNTIQPYATIGDNVTLWSGNHVGHHSRIGNHCFIASHVVISGGVVIEEQCFLGVNATLRDHITIGARCIIGAGTIILKDAAPDGLYIGQGTERADKPSSEQGKI